MPSFPKLTLTYFDFSGRAEAIRLAFHIGSVPFVDKRVTREEFGQCKSSLVYGQLPVLEVDGVELAQSQALLRYAGKLAGLYPVNEPMTALRVDELLGGLDDLNNKIGPSIHESDPEKKKAMRIELANNTIPSFLKRIEARLTKLHTSPGFDINNLYIHDVLIYTQLQALKSGRLDHIPTNIANGYTLVNASEAKVIAHSKVQQWNLAHSIKDTKFKLTYFDIAARGEPIRLAFVLGGIPFEDERIDRAELEKRRASLPFGQLPVLEINGEMFSQSLGLTRYIGTLTGLYPTNDPKLALRIDEFMNRMDDFFNVYGPVFAIPDEQVRVQTRKSLYETKLIAMLENLDQRVAHWGGPFATGASLTLADLMIYSQVANLKRGHLVGIPTTCADGHQNLMRVYNQVRNHDKVKDVAWLAEY